MWFLKVILFVGTVGMIQDLITTDRKESRTLHVRIIDDNSDHKVTTVKKINLNLISKALTPN